MDETIEIYPNNAFNKYYKLFSMDLFNLYCKNSIDRKQKELTNFFN